MLAFIKRLLYNTMCKGLMTFLFCCKSFIKRVNKTMRAERRREIERQMNDEKSVAPHKNGLFVFISLLYIAAAGAFLYFIFKLDVLPAKYLYGGIGVLAVISLFTLPVMISSKGKHGRKVGAAILSLIMIMGFGLGTYYLYSTSDFLDDITKKSVPTERFYVLVKKADMPKGEEYENMSKSEKRAHNLESLAGSTVGTFASNDNMYSKAKAMLQEKTTVEYAYDDQAATSVQRLINGEHKSILIPKATYEALRTEGTFDMKKETGILYTVRVPKETVDRTRAVDVTKECFNIYVSGTDQDGARTDVNMIATVNPVKHEVLLTSIPRDLYVELPSKEAKDKLTHSSIYGMEETVAAAEKEFGIEINYFVRVGYSAVRGVVNAIGGIDVESQYDFYTSGMGRLDGTHFVVGINHMDGDAALAFCRERHSFMSGDMTRNENQQAVLQAILEKATSSKEILTSYTSILDAVSGKMKTDMSTDDMSALIKMQLNSMPKWTIRKTAIKGETGSDFCYSLGQYASVVYAMPDEITKACDEMAKTCMMD